MWVVAGFVGAFGLLTYFCLLADLREERERGKTQAGPADTETLG